MATQTGNPRLGMRGKNERLPLLLEIRDRKGQVAMPAIYCLVNPQNFDRRASFSVNRYLTRGAWVEENYGQNLDEISATASTAAFVSSMGLVTTGAGEGGIANTEAYQNYEALVAVYRNNGEAYYTDGQVIALGSVVLTYDAGSYQGFFTNFTKRELAEKPFAFSLDFTFKVTKTVTMVVR